MKIFEGDELLWWPDADDADETEDADDVGEETEATIKTKTYTQSERFMNTSLSKGENGEVVGFSR